MEKSKKDSFADLSRSAAEAKESDRFIALLLERSGLINDVIDAEATFSEKEVSEWLEREKVMLARLEQEKKEVIRKMDNLSASRKAVRHYSSKFPIPSMPVFFDLAG